MDQARAETQDSEAEYALLGIGLAEPDMWPSILARVGPDDFDSLWVSTLMAFVQRNLANGIRVGMAEMATQVESDQRRYLARLRVGAPPAARLGYWCDKIREQSGRRRLERMSWHIRGAVREGSQSVAEIAQSAMRELGEVVEPGISARMLSPEEWLARWDADMERRSEQSEAGRLGIPTGFATLDRDVIVEPTHMVLVAAETGVGKTAFGLAVAANAAMSGSTVVYANTEMRPEDMANRIIAAETGIPLHDLRRGWLTAEQHKRVAEFRDQLLRDGRLHLSEPLSGSHPDAIAHLARAYHAEHGCDVLVVDYVGRLDLAPQGNGDREWQVLERTAARMKGLAVELKCAVYLLVQRTEDGTIAGSRRMKNDADLVLEIVRAPGDDDTQSRGRRKQSKYPDATHVVSVTKSRHSAGHFGIAVEFDAQHMSWRELGRV